MTGELEITVVREGRPARAHELVVDLIRCARTLLEETGWCPPAIFDSIERGLELAVDELPPDPAFGERPAGARR